MEEEAQLGLVVIIDGDFKRYYAADGNQYASIKIDFVTFTIPVDDMGGGEAINGHIPQHGSPQVVAPSSEKAVEEVERGIKVDLLPSDSMVIVTDEARIV